MHDATAHYGDNDIIQYKTPSDDFSKTAEAK
jgi:hypothetical protein